MHINQVTSMNTLSNMKPNHCISENKNSPNFKAKYLLQIPREKFSNPENLSECLKVVKKKLGEFTKVRSNSTISKYIMAIFPNLAPKMAKIDCFAEKRSYYYATKLLEDFFPECSITWLKWNTGLPIESAIDEKYHSFYVYTKKDIVNSAHVLRSDLKTVKDTVSKTWQIGLQKRQEVANGTLSQQQAYDSALTESVKQQVIEMGIRGDKILAERGGYTPDKTFVLDNIEDLPNILKQLDI